MYSVHIPMYFQPLLTPYLNACEQAAQAVGFGAMKITFTERAEIQCLGGKQPLLLSVFNDQVSWQKSGKVPSHLAICYGFSLSTTNEHQSSLAIGVNMDGEHQYDQINLSHLPQQRLYSCALDWTDEQKYQHLAWLLTSLALGFFIEDAAVIAHAAMRQNQRLNRPQTQAKLVWPQDIKDFPKLAQEQYQSEASGYGKESPFALYPVVDSVQWIETLLKLGVKTVQLRIKDHQPHQVQEDIARAVALGRTYQAQVYINDYWQLAIEHGAYGVHLGQEDLFTADTQALQQAGIQLGVSTHGYYEILKARALNPSYIALGHIFPTTTKSMPSSPQGLVKLALYQQLLNDEFTTVAIGGIDLTNAAQVWRTGVTSLAVVRAITQADDIQWALHQFHQILGKATKPTAH